MDAVVPLPIWLNFHLPAPDLTTAIIGPGTEVASPMRMMRQS
ncbi:hypothetical protein GMO_16440 [Gluconobacter morbifer G707]|uniref:Uncharacterized protein n=1 Tax=Gluconobacter morbifer G707 TaxID=1088869 RepID=G6XJR5_9PROT|nr:hypothetical protein GMO_16440 [Gluconobacter morbifer G707]